MIDLKSRSHRHPHPTRVALVIDVADGVLQHTPVRWALEQLKDELKAKDVLIEERSSLDQVSPAAMPVLVGGHASTRARSLLDAAGVSIPDVPEALVLLRVQAKNRSALVVSGSDARGLVYGILEVADRVHHAVDPIGELQQIDRIVEHPVNPIRSVARLFTSEVEDKPWYEDKSFWQRYLSMLIGQRFNRFSLTLGLGYNAPRRVLDSYFYFAYPFLISVPDYEVKAVGLPDEQRERNLSMLRWISEQAAARGLHFQLGLWTHAYQFVDSPDVNYVIAGLTPETHAAYCRDALQKLLDACPAIGGITFRAHSESGVPERSHEFWRTVFDGVVRTGRRVEIDIHSKGIDHELIEIALETGLPVNISPKYCAEHMGLPYHQAAIRPLEWDRPAPGSNPSLERQRSFTRYGYADYLTEGRAYGVLYRIWTGTQRLLLWGDPALAAGYGRYAHFCGSLGLELCEPLSFKGCAGTGVADSRHGYADVSLRPAGGDWEKYLYTYRLWGRLLYNPDTPRDSWGRFLRTEFGPAAPYCESALGHASRLLPLITTAHCPSASKDVYWPEMYTNMPIVEPSRPHPYGDTPSPKRFGAVSPLDPAFFARIDDLADELVSGKRTGKYSPLDVARWLDGYAQTAEIDLARAETKVSRPDRPSFRRLAIDVSLQIGLGRFFAEKFRAALAYALYQRTGDRAMLTEALIRYRAARAGWAKLATDARGVYSEDVAFGLARHLRGHWADRLVAIDQDLADMESKWQEESSAAPVSENEDLTLAWIEDVHGIHAESKEPSPQCHHLPPGSFGRGEPVAIEIAVEAGYQLALACLHYRHVNQADDEQREEMSMMGDRCRSVIPAEYTDSPYPLMYYFELHGLRGNAWLYPGLDANLANQPYFVVRQA